MLFQAKFFELQRHLVYIRRECEALRVLAYPNLDARLQMRLAELQIMEQKASDLRAELTLYRASTKPALDPWRQLFKRLTKLANAVQWLRITELPAYLAITPHDHYMARVFEALHREVGLPSVRPVTSLHQIKWFATDASLPTHPLYFAPASLVEDPGELPLVFHEIGHILFQLWDPDLYRSVERVVVSTFRRKQREAQEESDPKIREGKKKAVTDWQVQVANEIEETVCDIIGVLLGGPAFPVALSIGLLSVSAEPFGRPITGYPPLDCRMRLGGIVLRYRGLDNALLDAVEAGWAQIQALYNGTQPRWYNWLYDDQYLHDLTVAVETFLLGRGLQLYDANTAGLRAQLTVGAVAQLSGDSD